MTPGIAEIYFTFAGGMTKDHTIERDSDDDESNMTN